MIDVNALREVSYIIEFDSTSSTYKYALLKATINASQKYEHLISLHNDRAYIPLGIIVEQWIVDYMPFVFENIAQQNNKAILDAQIVQLYKSIFAYIGIDNNASWEYAYTQFTRAFKYEVMPANLYTLFFKLSKEMAKKIVTMPMKYTGKEHYEFFQPSQLTFGHIKHNKYQTYDLSYLLHSFDDFSISQAHYEIFRYLGQTLYGTSTILSKWKSKTIVLNSEENLVDKIDNILTTTFDTRDTSQARSIFIGDQVCVWSGELIHQNNMDIDHILPYSVWFNNDLWNLLPAERNLNQKKKKDKIPTRELITKRADIIVNYWQKYEKAMPQLFSSQLTLSLTGKNESIIDYEYSIESLCKKSDYLIFDRGHVMFDL